MPYEGEYAQYRSINRIIESERVKALLSECEICKRDYKEDTAKLLSTPQVKPSGWLPNWVIAVDGSKQEIPIKNGFPGAEVSYVTVASVMLDIEKMLVLDSARPADPKEFRKIEQADSIDCAFPGCNVIIKKEVSAKSSLRKALFETFKDVRMADDGETLLDTYEALLEYKPDKNPECPYDDCKNKDKYFTRSKGQYICACQLKRPLYSTDALRIHEGMNQVGSNGALFAEVMQVLERVWVIHVLRTIEQKNWLTSLQRLAIVLDGPLAIFGHPAWLSEAIYKELSRINNIALDINKQDILLVGIEKTGFFVDHFDSLDCNPEEAGERLPNQTTFLLTDKYIKENIIFSESEKFYGDQTYFGRKFFYKTESGARIVATVPFLKEEHKDRNDIDPNLFPRITDALSLLDKLASSRYPNALIPLVSAHAEAAIPMNLGRRVLEKLARELVRS
jgi:hypothetical protein